MQIKFHLFVITALERGGRRLHPPVSLLPVKLDPILLLLLYDILG
jgi:hypothetical protein